jgi:hypothetical protein
MKKWLLTWALMGFVLGGCAKAPAPDKSPHTQDNTPTQSEPDKETPPLKEKTTINAQGLVSRIKVEGVQVTMTVENPTDGERVFCDYHTPFEGIANNIFVLKNAAGEELDYQGIMKKRAPPGPENHVVLAPGASRSATVDLTSAYTLKKGTHSLRYRGTDISGLSDSNTVTFEVK